MCVFLISPVPIAEPLTSELIDTPVFYNLAPRPIKYRVSVPIPTHVMCKKNPILLSFTHYHVIPNLLSSVEHTDFHIKGKNTMEVNGDQMLVTHII